MIWPIFQYYLEYCHINHQYKCLQTQTPFQRKNKVYTKVNKTDKPSKNAVDQITERYSKEISVAMSDEIVEYQIQVNLLQVYLLKVKYQTKTFKYQTQINIRLGKSTVISFKFLALIDLLQKYCQQTAMFDPCIIPLYMF